jgi:hypothetical protein
MNPSASVYLGGLAQIHLNKYWAVQSELTYSCQGAKKSTDGGEFTWRLNYINLPILLQYMFDNGIRMQTGPQLGILASAKLKSGGTITDINNINKSGSTGKLQNRVFQAGYFTCLKIYFFGFNQVLGFGIGAYYFYLRFAKGELCS